MNELDVKMINKEQVVVSNDNQPAEKIVLPHVDCGEKADSGDNDVNTVKREISRYIENPKAMYVGAPGKTGYLNLGFEIDQWGKSIMREHERRVPLIVQKELYFDEEMPEMPCVYILSSGGPNVDGDRYEQNFTVRKDAYAFISTGAATKIAEMRFNYSSLIQHFNLEENSYLEFLPEPVIPCAHSRFISDTTIRIDQSATLFYSEIYMAGRKYYKDGELFQYDVLSVCTRGERPDGKPLFREKFVIEPFLKSPRLLGVMAQYDVFANVIVLTPPIHRDNIYDAFQPYIDKENRVAVGITKLPNDCGLLFKVVGMETSPVKKIVREFCSKVRMEIKNKPLPQEFPWR